MLNPETSADAEVASAQTSASTPPAQAGTPKNGAGPSRGGDRLRQVSTRKEPADEDRPPDEPPFVPWSERIAKWFHEYGLAMGVYLLSTVFHAVIAVVLGLIMLPPDAVEELLRITVSTVAEDTEAEEEEALEFVEQPQVLDVEPVDANPMEVVTENAADASEPIELDINDLDPSLKIEDVESAAPNVKIDLKSDFGGRSQAARAAMLRQFGGTEASEAAVASGLKWLVNHQNPDGSWSFDHVQAGSCGNSCTQPGSLKNKTGATGMALLAFLGAGHTHEQGHYKEVVKKGINFLLKNMVATPDGGDLRGDQRAGGHAGMYVQGLATIAICEAHALTKDRRLRRAAQHAIQFIIRAQHPTGGGWRYRPREPGDTSVVGWQVMAIKSAQAAKIRIPREVLRGASYFLDRVQADDGAQYGYTGPQTGRPATSAIGLLCRMYLGWDRKHKGLQRGVGYLDKLGPATNNMYYNYYATQVMHHWGGKEWRKWNAVMRDQLVNSQDKKGHANGSWRPNDAHGGAGGRLYMTCMCIMTLEVYYRHLPLYQREALSAEF